MATTGNCACSVQRVNTYPTAGVRLIHDLAGPGEDQHHAQQAARQEAGALVLGGLDSLRLTVNSPGLVV